jgi:hypothetical protein
MRERREGLPPEGPPGWAIRQATDELPAGSKQSEVTELACALARAAAERYEERHDEYDDPDQGGEA